MNNSLEDQSNYEELDTPEEACKYEKINADTSTQLHAHCNPSEGTSMTIHELPQYQQTLSSEIGHQWVPITTGIQHPVPTFAPCQALQTLGQQNIAPIQTQPVHFRPLTVVLQEQQNGIEESLYVKRLNKECFAVVSVSLMLMIIFLIIGGPLTLGFTISGMVCLTKASHRGVGNKKRNFNEWGCGLHIAGGIFAVFSAPIWGCVVGLVVCLITIL